MLTDAPRWRGLWVEVWPALVILILGWMVLTLWLETPQVYRRWPDGACIAVYPAAAGTCRDLPPRHALIWVGATALDASGERAGR